MQYLYNNYVKTLSERLLSELSTIETGNNYEYGAEFEIVLCQVLRKLLPDKFGIVRGYVVSPNGQSEGDDIIIFERNRFPTLALRHRDDFARKEFIPIDTVYCYIEAKHTIFLNENHNHRQSLFYAIEQVAKVKRLCLSRNKVKPENVFPYIVTKGQFHASTPEGFPEFRNPLLGIIMARHVKKDKSDKQPITDGAKIEEIIGTLQLKAAQDYLPDLFILSNNVTILPAMQTGDKKAEYKSPFLVPNKSRFVTQVNPGIAFGLGFFSIMYAIDWIQLGVLPWQKLILDALIKSNQKKSVLKNQKPFA